ncbi:trafficking protein particle complex subunit 2-like protein [Coccinella septempunctata]|uniref:trafficking protein particle complex subunit 2-like protein n=1 Tax=Coccinella septempunctata TaxID=41139 RepID=UPI001D066DC4|nr:trafficking protein particle complex subunit 2-like protein [Coccinella septempunctata]
MAVCVAIIGKDNSPKFICCLNPDEELRFQYKVLSSLDIVEEKINGGNKPVDNRELFLGMLYAIETHKIYGYVTNTKIKFIIVVDSSNMALRDNEIRSMFRKIHSEYTDIVCNPFYTPGEPITFKSFTTTIKNIMTGTV